MDKILAAKRTDRHADVSAPEREIDERVYRFYGLTAEKIKIVEESASRSQPDRRTLDEVLFDVVGLLGLMRKESWTF
ncbi:MAG: hypothetical protein N2561_00410 [Bacteroidetes bacterium]|nr:hypothetical protein [Bacteroidota bacterium]